MLTFLKVSFVAWLVMPNPLTIFEGGCSYLTYLLSMMCRLQQRFQITDMTLESKVKVI